MDIKKLALIGGLAGSLSGCVVYDDGYGVEIAPATSTTYIGSTVVTPAIVEPAPVIAPAIIAPAYYPLLWGPRFHHHHGRW